MVDIHISEIVFGVFVFASAVQLFYYLYFYARVAWFKPKDNYHTQPPVSVVICAKNEALKIKNETDEYVRSKKTEIAEESAKLTAKSTIIESKEAEVSKKQSEISTLKDQLEVKVKNYDELIQSEQEKLEKISKLTVEEAKKRLIETVDRELKEEYGKKYIQLRNQ